MILSPRIAMAIAALCTLLLLPMVSFSFKAKKATATVLEVTSSNGRCGSLRNLFARQCTRYQARVAFEVASQRREATVHAGSKRGYGQPLSGADVQPGQQATVLYLAHDPSDARLDSFWETPFGSVLALLLTFVAAFAGLMLRGVFRRAG